MAQIPQASKALKAERGINEGIKCHKYFENAKEKIREQLEKKLRMKGVYIRKQVTASQFRDIKNSEFIDLIIETDDVSDKIRLYPTKTIIEEYF